MDCGEVDRVVSDFTGGVKAWGERVEALPDAEPCIAAALTAALDAEDWDRFSLYLAAAGKRPDPSMTGTLCRSLQVETTDVRHEEVLEVMLDIPDPAALPVLGDMVHRHFPWDPHRQIALKALWVIGEIDTPEAHATLRGVVEKESAYLSDWAASALEARW